MPLVPTRGVTIQKRVLPVRCLLTSRVMQRVYDHLGQVRRQFEGIDGADAHALVADLGLAGRQAFGAGEADGDRGAALDQGVPAPAIAAPLCAGRRRSASHTTLTVPPYPLCLGRRRIREAAGLVAGHEPTAGWWHRVLRHMRRGSKHCAAIMVISTTPANASAPRSGRTRSSAPNCTSAPSSEIMKTSILDQRPMLSIRRGTGALSQLMRGASPGQGTAAQASPNSLASGTTTLAMNTMTASGHRS